MALSSNRVVKLITCKIFTIYKPNNKQTVRFMLVLNKHVYIRKKKLSDSYHDGSSPV